MNILIAEDDTVSRLLLSKFLQILNHSVVQTSSGEEMVERFKESPELFDLIITDVMMGGISGLEAARQIKAIRVIPVIALTALDHGVSLMDTNGKYISWCNCDLFLRKPLDLDSLKMVLQAVSEKFY